MIRIQLPSQFLLVSLSLALSSALAPAQVGGVSREAMWPAPTAADWSRPCLIRWQRSFEDAVAVSRQTGKPILVCTNMDGEIASEHYAGIRYRQPEIATLFEPYVPVIASVYRHTPRDYDEQGRRIECPRFGTVTCGEHIACEPGLFERFFDGERVAPRHVGVELDGAEVYDIYYALDTDSVFQAIRDGVADRPTPPPVVPGDRSLREWVANADSAEQVAVEQAYLAGDRDRRRELLQAAFAAGDAAPVGLLRLAVCGLDVELSRMARQALVVSKSVGAVDLINAALRVPLGTADRDALIAALIRLGETSPKAKMLADVHRGLNGRSGAVDLDGWAKALAGATTYRAAVSRDAVEARLVAGEQRSQGSPRSAAARLELAEASMAFAVEQVTAGSRRGRATGASRRFARLVLDDARRVALEAERLGADGWRVDAVVAIGAYYLGEEAEAYARAEKAVAEMPPDAHEWNAIAVLSVFAEARHNAIVRAIRKKEHWPREWLTDVNAAYSVLAQHPSGTATQVLSHLDFLKALGALGQASRVLDAGIARFPDSPGLHHRLRDRTIEESGVDGLEAVYSVMLGRYPDSPDVEWFAGYAAIVAAEFHRRASDQASAASAYDRAVAHYERVIVARPDNRDSSDHFIALAMAGRARLCLDAGDLEGALAQMLACFERRPGTAASRDGLNLSPVDTAKMLRQRLVAGGQDDLAKRLTLALDGLDPALLELPAFERGGRAGPRRRGRRRGGR